MLSEWRTNIWLVVELVVVIMALQVIFTALYTFYSLHDTGNGIDLRDIYVARLNVIDSGSDEYTPYDSVHSKRTDMDMLLAKLRDNPNVEIVATGTTQSLPYNYNFWGSSLTLKQDGDKENLSYFVNRRMMSPEMIRVLGIHGIKGETPDSLAALLAKGDILISPGERYAFDGIKDPGLMSGKDVVAGWDTLKTYHVGAVAHGLRRTDYEPMFAGTCYEPLDPSDVSVIAFRVKPGQGRRFAESLSDRDMQAGNLYLTDLQSIEDMRDSCQVDINQSIRNFTVCAVFMMMVIFLGFLGVFWFRTQQRVTEIAVRKVHGATTGAIYARFFAEGLIMLGVAVILTIPFTYWMIQGDIMNLFDMPSGVTTVVVGAVITVVTLAVLILAGVYAPARKATRVNPADALKDM